MYIDFWHGTELYVLQSSQQLHSFHMRQTVSHQGRIQDFSKGVSIHWVRLYGILTRLSMHNMLHLGGVWGHATPPPPRKILKIGYQIIESGGTFTLIFMYLFILHTCSTLVQMNLKVHCKYNNVNRG